ncbi:MAG: D-aminoacylase [Nitrospirota bacterium]
MRNSVDILIKDGLIYDGILSEPFVSNIAISGDRIQFIGDTRAKKAGIIIEAEGMSVAPGFIDTHSHSDFTILADPRAEGKLCQGITTEINGNCGMSAAPLYNDVTERRETDLNELDIKERWNTLEQYFRIIEKRGTATNLATLAGHGNIRGSVIGYDDIHPSEEELARMSLLLSETIDHGAIGLSTGLIYPPGIFSRTEELISLSDALRKNGLIYTSHMRSEGDMLLEAVQEVIRIGQKSGGKVHISHIKTAGERNRDKADKVIAIMDHALRSGIKLTCDRYPYTASSTDLDSIMPSWVFAGGNDEELRRLEDAGARKRIKDEMKEEAVSEGYWRKVVISSVVSEKNRWMEGRTVADVSKTLGESEIDAVFRILLEENLRAGAIFESMCEENLKKFLSLPFCMIGSDSSSRCFDGPTKKGKPHPRGFGTFPRFFGKYVRDKNLMPLSDAIHKATKLPAQTFGLKGRGVIKEGMYADLVVFDPKKIIDKATYDDPFQRPEGIYYVIVNGVPALWEGVPTGNLAGRILK